MYMFDLVWKVIRVYTCIWIYTHTYSCNNEVWCFCLNFSWSLVHNFMWLIYIWYFKPLGFHTEVGNGCIALTVTVRGRPAWLWFASAVYCFDLFGVGCMLSHKSGRVLYFLLGTAGGPNWTWCKPFSLNLCHLCKPHVLCLILSSGPSLRSCMTSFDGL